MTAPRTTGFISRKDAGLRPPRSVPRMPGPVRGVTVHYLGPAKSYRLNRNPAHCECRQVWSGIQRFHQVTRGWADVAYTLGICQAGHVLAGRGAGTRTAANGTKHGNDHYYAICFLLGGNQSPTGEALQAGAWAVASLRSAGAGSIVNSHRDHKATACPGDNLAAIVRDNLLHPTTIEEPEEMAEPVITVTLSPPDGLDGIYVADFRTLTLTRIGDPGDLHAFTSILDASGVPRRHYEDQGAHAFSGWRRVDRPDLLPDNDRDDPTIARILDEATEKGSN